MMKEWLNRIVQCDLVTLIVCKDMNAIFKGVNDANEYNLDEEKIFVVKY